MKKISAVSLILLGSFLAFSQAPAGEIKGPFKIESKVFPGTEREYWLYIPRQYDPSKETCIMVVQDGLSRANGWRLTSTLDSLITLNQIPPIIGIFVDHGKVPAAGTDNFPRYNRSLEYDALGDRYARFLIEELLPEIAKSYNISNDPNNRSIAGASSGAIAAFNVAWERPDQFRRVLSTIGTYVGLRGGDEFATLVRKTESKPIRVFLADGSSDLNIYAGDWWMANQNMLTALTWAGYEVNHAWGDGGHDSKHAVTIMASALRWLWSDYPKPVTIHKSEARRLDPVLDNETWKELNLNQAKAYRIAVNDKGEVFFTDKKEIYKIDLNGNVVLFSKLKGIAGGISFNSDGKLYVGDTRLHKIFTIDASGRAEDVIKNVNAEELAITSKGVYFSDATQDRLGFYSFASKEVKYVYLSGHPTGIAVGAEQTFMTVGMSNSVFGSSLKIKEDGNLEFPQEYVHYHVGYGDTTPSALGMTVDSENLLYTSTEMGIQVSDQLGRVNYIFSRPLPSSGDVKFGGDGFKALYLTSEGRLFSRKVSRQGILPWKPAIKPPKPGL